MTGERQSSAGRVAGITLALAAVMLVWAAVASVAWWRAARRAPSIDELSSADREALVEKLVTLSPGVLQSAWYEPGIGYTLRPSSPITAWRDEFQSNSIGYRSGPPEKEAGVYRVVFVGDSWTYGMGVKTDETYPHYVGELARELEPQRRIEAWTLALPGYNTLNELAALWYFFDLLQPDAVVIAPTANDNHSTNRLLPNGSLTRQGAGRDDFGDEHVVTYRMNYFQSYRALERWRRVFEELRASEERLQALDVPLLYFFVARWDPAVVHHFVGRYGLESPYLVVPIRLTLKEWLNAPPITHGTPAANRIFAEAVYDGLARTTGWRRADLGTDASDIAYFDAVPRGDWDRRAGEVMRAVAQRHPRPGYRPGADTAAQVAGASDPTLANVGDATTLLLLHEGARALRLTVEPIAGLDHLFPLEIKASIPSPGGGSSRSATIESRGAQRIEVAVPDDLDEGTALDLVIAAQRSAKSPDGWGPASVRVVGVEPLD